MNAHVFILVSRACGMPGSIEQPIVDNFQLAVDSCLSKNTWPGSGSDSGYVCVSMAYLLYN